MIDRDDIEQALEITAGSRISGEAYKRRTAPEKAISRIRNDVRRFLKELPPEVTVWEILESFNGRS